MEIEFALGFKGLRMGGTDPRGEPFVYSASLPFRWCAPVVEMERCEKCGCASPSKDCDCGIHASYFVGVIITEYMETPASFLALVKGCGRLRLGQFGWRAQQCAVLAVLEVSPTDEARRGNNEYAAGYFGAVVTPLEQAVIQVEGWRRYYARELEV